MGEKSLPGMNCITVVYVPCSLEELISGSFPVKQFSAFDGENYVSRCLHFIFKF